MKISKLIVLALMLSACSMNPEKAAEIEQKENNAKIAQERANRMGQLPGTPDNIDAINRDNRDATRSRDEARAIKEDSWFVVFIDFLLGK